MCTSANFHLNQKNYGPFDMQGMGSNYLSATLNPGDAGIVDAIYDPAAHGPAGVGMADRFIYLEDASGGQLKLEIKSVVTP